MYTCTLFRGIYLDIVMDYSTEKILHMTRRLMAAKGNVRLIISDAGSQLRAADAKMKEWRHGWSEQDFI